MCGRVTLTVSSAELAEVFDLFALTAQLEPRYNIAPTQTIAAILVEDSASVKRELRFLHWGLIPEWSADRSGAAALINARAETVASKPAFRESFKRRRCIIPASGFYEWRKNGGRGKHAFHIRPKDQPLFGFAGLWDTWHDGSGAEVRSACIITVPANALIAEFHDRMPAILRRDDFGAWLDPRNEDVPACKRMLVPRDPSEMEIVPVGTFVNSAVNEGSRCVERVEPEALLF